MDYELWGGKLFPADDDRLGTIDSFVQRELRKEVAAPEGPIARCMKPDSDERIVKLSSGLEGRGRKELFIRDATRVTVSNILSFFERDLDSWLILGGSRGCGKTVDALLAVILLAARGRVVAYSHKGRFMLLTTERISDDDRQCLNRVFDCASIPRIPFRTQVWTIETTVDAFIEAFRYEQRFIFVQDLNDGYAKIPSRAGTGRRMIVSSPDPLLDRCVNFDMIPLLMIVPSWSVQDMRMLAGEFSEGMMERFNRLGGLPFYAVDLAEYDDMLDLQAFRLSHMDADDLNNLFRVKSYWALPHIVNEFLVRIEPSSTFDFKYGQQFELILSSSYVANALVDHLVAFFTQENEILDFIRLIRTYPQLDSLKRRVLDQVVHNILGGPGNSTTMSMFRFSNRASGKLVSLYSKKPKMEFASNLGYVEDAGSLNVQRGVYVYTKSKTLGAPDSFCVVDEAFVIKYFPRHPMLLQGKPPINAFSSVSTSHLAHPMS